MLFSYHTEQTGHEFRVDQAVIYTTGVNYKKTLTLCCSRFISLNHSKNRKASAILCFTQLISHFILHFTTNKTLESLRCGHREMHPVSPHLKPRLLVTDFAILLFQRDFATQPTWQYC